MRPYKRCNSAGQGPGGLWAKRLAPAATDTFSGSSSGPSPTAHRSRRPASARLGGAVKFWYPLKARPFLYLHKTAKAAQSQSAAGAQKANKRQKHIPKGHTSSAKKRKRQDTKQCKKQIQIPGFFGSVNVHFYLITYRRYGAHH